MCGNVTCLFSNDRKYKNHPNLKAILFYGSKFNQSDLPLPRNGILWALLHEESPRNTPILSHEPVLSLFNYSSTFSRYSDVPLTLQYLTSIEDLTSKKYFKTVEQKNKLLSDLSPVIYIQSDCVTPINRDSYVAELMKYINVDSYGGCLHNKNLPVSLQDSMKTMMSPELFQFVSQYKFAIAFENGICDDYITEKLWRPLIAGTVPIYIGSPSVKDWLPNNMSVIFAFDFDSPMHLATYLHQLNTDPEQYKRHLRHKINGSVDNKLLLDEMASRGWSTDNSYEAVTLIDAFMCSVCKRTYSRVESTVGQKQYDCPRPVSSLTRRDNQSNWWHNDWDISACEAKTVRGLVNRNVNFTESELRDLTFSNIVNNKCQIGLKDHNTPT
ncbi:hypothetical protein AAG570_003353 [Ranatra chinensis]|uniref:Fucosyltransferase n=1 Tax=Ranatra chinensis TaxID=642074 RepID=A0ABD0Y3F5_9HEMI